MQNTMLFIQEKNWAPGQDVLSHKILSFNSLKPIDGYINLREIGSGLLPDGTKPLPKSMLTSH